MDGSDRLAEVVRTEGGRVLATLVRHLGDWSLAEEAVQEAAIAALQTWPTHGVPDEPRAWLTVTAKRKAIDVLRRERARGDKERAADGAGRRWRGPTSRGRPRGATPWTTTCSG